MAATTAAAAHDPDPDPRAHSTWRIDPRAGAVRGDGVRRLAGHPRARSHRAARGHSKQCGSMNHGTPVTPGRRFQRSRPGSAATHIRTKQSRRPCRTAPVGSISLGSPAGPRKAAPAAGHPPPQARAGTDTDPSGGVTSPALPNAASAPPPSASHPLRRRRPQHSRPQRRRPPAPARRRIRARRRAPTAQLSPRRPVFDHHRHGSGMGIILPAAIVTSRVADAAGVRASHHQARS